MFVCVCSRVHDARGASPCYCKHMSVHVLVFISSIGEPAWTQASDFINSPDAQCSTESDCGDNWTDARLKEEGNREW